jgi:TPR repeat protein
MRKTAARVAFVFAMLCPWGTAYTQTTAPSSSELLERAQSGDANAQFELGRAFEDGKGFPQDDDLAVEWFRKAAEQGNAKAQSSLGAMYSVGRGVARDKEEAVRWYKKAARQGLPEGMYNVAIAYFNGEGVSEDLNVAYAWMLAAKNRGNMQAGEALKHIRDEMGGHVEVGMLRLAEMYERGDEIAKDPEASVRIYRELAQDGFFLYAGDARLKMCQFYATGSGVPLDLVEAKSWCKKAGVAGALVFLGQIAEQEKDYREAEKLYEKAIYARNGNGFLPLAKLKMQDGPAGERDAYFWLYLAKEFNIAGSDVQLREVAARLSAGDIKKEENKAYQWLVRHAPQKTKGMKQP